MQFLSDYKVRKWLYGIATAVLVVLGGYGLIDSVATENFTNLIGAVLNLGAASATTLAARKAEPSLVERVDETSGAIIINSEELAELAEVIETGEISLPRHAL